MKKILLILFILATCSWVSAIKCDNCNLCKAKCRADLAKCIQENPNSKECDKKWGDCSVNCVLLYPSSYCPFESTTSY